MARHPGINFLLWVTNGTTAYKVGGQRNATLSLSGETVDATNKEVSFGVEQWRETVATFRTWSIDFESIVTDSSGAQDTATDLMLDSFFNGAAIQTDFRVYLEFPSSFTSDRYFYGYAFASDLSVDTPFDDVAVWSGTLDGNGRMQRGNTAPSPNFGR